MPAEIKIQCECGHSKLISKSNISAHRKSKTHAKNMAAIGTDEPQEFENTIICSEVKASEPKVKAVKKTAVKKTKPVVEHVEPVEEVAVEIEEEVVEHVEPVEEVAVEIEEEVVEHVEPVEEVTKSFTCDILGYLQRIEKHLKKIDEFHEKLEISLIDCDIANAVKSIGERLKKIEEIQDAEPEQKDYRFTVWTQKQYFNNRVIDEIKRRNHPIFKGIDDDEPDEEVAVEIEEEVAVEIEEEVAVEIEEEVPEWLTFDSLGYLQINEKHLKMLDEFNGKSITIEIEIEPEEDEDEEVEILIGLINEMITTTEEEEDEPVETIEEVTEIIEEVIKTIEEEDEPVDKKINHKSITGSEWLEYIPDDDTHSTSVMAYLTTNLKIDKKIVEHLKVKFIYFENKFQIQICASDIITDTPPIKLYQCNTYEEHFTGGNANSFKIYCDESIEYKCDFLKKKKYNTFRCSTFKKLVKREEAAENIFFKIEDEILKYSKGNPCNIFQKDNPAKIIEEPPQIQCETNPKKKRSKIGKRNEPELTGQQETIQKLQKISKRAGSKWTLF